MTTMEVKVQIYNVVLKSLSESFRFATSHKHITHPSFLSACAEKLVEDLIKNAPNKKAAQSDLKPEPPQNQPMTVDDL